MNNSTKKLALYTAIAVTYLITAAFIVLCRAIYGEIPGFSTLIVLVVTFIVTFFVFKYTIENFIYDRIKLIYKTIHNYKVKKKTKFKLDYSKDIIHEVNQEVSNWADEQNKEIMELKKMEQYRKEFLGNVSHELKTPIFSIQGYISTLLEGGMDDPNINRDYLERAEKNIERLTNIVTDLESISRHESGELNLEYSIFSMTALTKEVFDSLEMKAAQKKITLYIGNSEDKSFMVYADKERIRQVMVNLIRNSVSYGNEKGKTKVSFFEMDDNMLVEVTDDGIGIDQKDLPRIFERFYRTDESRSREHGGTGLGLAIVKHIIEAHEQAVNVRSTIGVGTTFSFTLKRA
ncbi:MAG: sensor histidine kinase [Bacteroidia bacterium]|nr:sensor histidine kinase [Bacteroidia bacterium]